MVQFLGPSVLSELPSWSSLWGAGASMVCLMAWMCLGPLKNGKQYQTIPVESVEQIVWFVWFPTRDPCANGNFANICQFQYVSVKKRFALSECSVFALCGSVHRRLKRPFQSLPTISPMRSRVSREYSLSTLQITLNYYSRQRVHNSQLLFGLVCCKAFAMAWMWSLRIVRTSRRIN